MRRRFGAALLVIAGCGRIGFDETISSGADDARSDGAAVDAGPRMNRAFVTSAPFSVPFGGAAAATVACQTAADDAGLGGSFVALIGDETQRPDTIVQGARGWVDLAGRGLVDQPVEWFNGEMRRPLRRDELGTWQGYGDIWLGVVAGSTCASYSSTANNASVGYTTNYFTGNFLSSCGNARRLACVETAFTEPLVEPIQAGRYVFVTTALWMSGGSITSADVVCQDEAILAGLTGSFRAALATSTGGPFARWSDLSGPWITIGGRHIADSLAASTTHLDAFLHQRDGSPAISSPPQWAWTGSPGANCSDWTSTSTDGVAGDAASVDMARLKQGQLYLCDTARPLICVQD